LKVSITNELTGLSDRGTLVSISHRTSTSGSIGGGPYVRARIRPSRPLRVSLIGQDVQITITTARSDGPVLTVPEAAVFAEPNGSTYVTTVSATGDQVRVRVRVGVTGNGLVQITPLGGSLVRAESRVVTGENYAGTGSGAGNGPGTPSSGSGESGVG
jgi:multidrug efflux pump subunit AcrA (membrane-fusion protein)